MSGADCLIVMYHYVRDADATPFPRIRALSRAMFEQQLDWLQETHTVINVTDLEAAVAGRASLPPSAALLTFDDGFIDHYETVFPALRRRGLSGVFFISRDASGEAPRLLGVHQTHFLLATLGAEAFGRAVRDACQAAYAGREQTDRSVFGVDRWDDISERAIKQLLNYDLPFEEADRVLDALFVEHIGDPAAFARQLYLNDAMVRDMAAGGVSFGYHTRSHRMLSRLGVREQGLEISGGVEWLAGLTGQRTVTFCYPWGGAATYTADTVRLLRAGGYSLAFNTIRRPAVVGTDDPFELPRVDTRDLPPYTMYTTRS